MGLIFCHTYSVVLRGCCLRQQKYMIILTLKLYYCLIICLMMNYLYNMSYQRVSYFSLPIAIAVSSQKQVTDSKESTEIHRLDLSSIL